MFSFLIVPGSFDVHDLDTLFNWMDTEDMEMQLIELTRQSAVGDKVGDKVGEVCRAQKIVRSHTSARSRSPHPHLLRICT